MTSNILNAFGRLLKMPAFYYAVAKGRNPGIYHSWPECQAQVSGFSRPVFKKFPSQSEAEDFIKQRKGLSVASSKTFRSTKVLSEKPISKRLASPEIGSNERVVGKKRLRSENESESVETAKKKPSDGSQGNDFNVDKDGYVNVYTDGACSSNGKAGARAGIGVWFGDDHPLNVSKPVMGKATNNMAEIQAVTTAANQAKKAGVKKLKINTDSKFLISCITLWMPGWKQNGWKTSTKKPVINKVELLEMEKALHSLDVVWNHVNGHVGIYGNEMADKLAREGCADYKKPSNVCK